jgi:hypothetical protein
MLTVIVAGRNDDYGKNFRDRLFRTALHNSSRLANAGIDFEYLLAEWNPLSDRPLLSEEFVHRVPNARAVIIPSDIHHKYSLNPKMPFHEMAAKNAALRRANGDIVLVTNADILLGDDVVDRIGRGDWSPDTLYRAHRIDVNPELDWTEIQDPANQLSSGEGRSCPPYYLGAGGDFCLADRDLWHSLGGFNDRIRFSTRAKDWQFFLSAAAQGVNIEFIGNVYHLDHGGGFRNTSSQERNSTSAHFGNWWDIEFGLPLTVREDWGFPNLGEHLVHDDARITALESKDYVIDEQEDRQDRKVMTWVTRPFDSSEISTAILLHSVCAAHREDRRLVCRIADPRLAVALSGFNAVASRFGVQVFCNWDWPLLHGYSVHRFAPEPRTLKSSDWILEEDDFGIHICEKGSGREIDPLPLTNPVSEQREFDPVLVRRLLRAYLQMQEQGTTKMAVYGAGSHTRSLIQWGVPDNIELVAILQSDDKEPRVTDGGIPLLRLSDATWFYSDPDSAILLSSSSFETDMLKACRNRGIRNVIALYGDWPRDLWSDAVKPSQRVYA